ncbi:SPOC domain-containing protein 1 isoform X3 [Hyla sarda]|uniref:SPOC domain-containing protein 1 isoform X3 n=1 Tax=Hyla sarda TaxID=327740 RepID=UPI0024C37B84|nr:SPOC domain-containing protein 1 isoform X3 [Hyla sarda]
MDKLHLEDPSKQDDRDCHSPLGLFEKFKVEFSSEAVSIPNANLQLPSGSESLSTLETQHPMVTPQNVKKLIPEKSSLLKRMRWMMDMASAASNEEDSVRHNGVKVVFYRREDESCALLGSWNADSKEVEILDELESPSNQKELDHQIIIQAFFQHVVLGNIIPQRLVQMSPTEMARQELTDWRNQERLHSLEIIEKAEKELNQHQQKIKLTHKGLIEIDTSPDQMFTLEDLSDSSWFSKDLQDSEVEKRSKIDTTAQHKSHLLDLNCLICMGKVKPSDMMDMNQWTNVKLPLKTTTENSDVEKLLSLEAGEAIENDALAAKSRNTCSSQSVAWKGFIQMFAIKQFKVTASQVSGYSDHLCQKLPKMITSKGFICQESVWEYVELIWPASTKDMCLLRFCPQTSSDAVFYSRLFSYLNRKVRYVIVNTDKMEAFVIPLPACQPIPSQLRPLGGPGLADDHPHLLLALLLPNHPFWSSCPRKVIKIHREEELDVPDDIFSSILEDVEREEKQMTEQGLPPIGNESSRVTEVGMPELMNILCFLSNNLQEIAAQNNSFQIGPPDNQPNPIPTAAPVWPSYLMAPGFQAPASNNNPAAMFDPSTMFGPSGFNPSL